ncbi:MAG: branched-chain amino acid ABC transporter permease [Ignavibacteriae bacterium]|nr:branched-chain amino acid ABC transporter permease [Ignavibacteriota bacterium]
MQQIILNILISSSLYLLVALSFSLIYYTTKFFNIALAALIVFGSYFVYLFSVQLNFPFLFAVILSVLIVIILGILNELLVFYHLRKKSVSSLKYFIASLGLYVILQNCVSLYFGDDSKVINNTEVLVGNKIFSVYITNIQLLTLFISSVLFISINLVLQKTKIGKSIRAVESNVNLCKIYGINEERIILISVCLSSFLAAIVGILSAFDTNMSPTFGFNLLLYGLVVIIIGGIGSTKGLISGSLLISSVQHFSAYYIDSKWMDLVTYIILISFLILKPLGFSGKRLRKVEI